MKRTLQLIALFLLAIPIIQKLSLAQTQGEMTRTAQEQAAASDKKLNEAYRQLVSVADPERKEKLLASQKAWLKFRDAQCDLEGDLTRGGNMTPQLQAMCLKRLTDERTATLDWLMDVDRTTATTQPAR